MKLYKTTPSLNNSFIHRFIQCFSLHLSTDNLISFHCYAKCSISLFAQHLKAAISADFCLLRVAVCFKIGTCLLQLASSRIHSPHLHPRYARRTVDRHGSYVLGHFAICYILLRNPCALAKQKNCLSILCALHNPSNILHLRRVDLLG